MTATSPTDRRAPVTFVIVHGGWGGGWEWTPVADILRAEGHRAFTPTLSGMAERGHLGPKIHLEDHVGEVARLIEFEDLHDVVLCGASYSGMVVTGAADRVADRVGLLVHVDSFIPLGGEALIDLVPDEFRTWVLATADEHGHGWLPVPEDLLPPRGLIPDEELRRYNARLRAQPTATAIESLRLTGGIERVPRAFLRCEMNGIEAMSPTTAARLIESGWPVRELPLPHDPHLFDPAATARALVELAALERPASLVRPG